MVIYIAGKYSGKTREEVQQNIDAAEQVGKQVLKAGHAPVIPHRISAHWDVDPDFPIEEWTHERFMNDFCLPLLDKCDAIYLMKGWQDSAGAVIEATRARETGKKIFSPGTFGQTV